MNTRDIELSICLIGYVLCIPYLAWLTALIQAVIRATIQWGYIGDNHELHCRLNTDVYQHCSLGKDLSENAWGEIFRPRKKLNVNTYYRDLAVT